VAGDSGYGYGDFAPVTIPFELNGRHILLKGKVNEKPVTFVLDTGDQVAIVDLDVAQRLNLKLPVRSKLAGRDPVHQRALSLRCDLHVGWTRRFFAAGEVGVGSGKTLSPRAGRDFEGSSARSSLKSMWSRSITRRKC
jgi:hypothetical protein